MIHTFGDSHSNFAWRNCLDLKVRVHWLGSILCFSFGNEKLGRCNISEFKMQDGDSVVFSFGEIDCRNHIKKHVNSENTYQNIIDKIVLKYIQAIILNIKECKVKLKNVCIYNIPPPLQRNNKGVDSGLSKQFPFVGTDEERKSYVTYFNKELKAKCNENNWIFVDVYDEYSDENGFLNNDLSDGSVHIQNPKFLRKFILKYIN